jgi:hypothetical protein
MTIQASKPVRYEQPQTYCGSVPVVESHRVVELQPVVKCRNCGAPGQVYHGECRYCGEVT